MGFNSGFKGLKTVTVRNTDRINPISIFAKLFPTQWQTTHLVFGPLWHLRNTHTELPNLNISRSRNIG